MEFIYSATKNTKLKMIPPSFNPNLIIVIIVFIIGVGFIINEIRTKK